MRNYVSFVVLIFSISGYFATQSLDNWNQKNLKNSQEQTYYDSDLVRKNETNLEGIPHFILEPKKVYFVYEDQPVKIKCIAEPVSHVNIICNKETFSYMDKEVSESNLRVTKLNKNGDVDLQGLRWMFSLEITYKKVVEFFNTFHCFCEAWNHIPSLSQAKKVHSRTTEIKEAYFETKFKKTPQSANIVAGQTLILACEPPEGKPKPEIKWMKNNDKLFDNGRIKIVGYQLTIDDTVVSDGGNYSCIATSLALKRHSPIAVVRVTDKTSHLWSQWTTWSQCDYNCKKIRTRQCLAGDECKGGREETLMCPPKECEDNRAVAPYVKNPDNKNGATSTSVQEARDIAMYVGLFIAVSVLVMVITIIFCLIRRKAFLSLRNSGNGMGYNVKANLIKSSNMVTIKNANTMNSSVAKIAHQRSYLSQSPPNLPPPTCLSDISSNNPYSNGIDLSYNSTGSVNFSQPLISHSSSGSTTNKSKATSSSNTDPKAEPVTVSGTPVNSRPPSALYHELSLDRESVTNVHPFVSDTIDINTLSWGMISSSGGRLCLPQSGISLTIAPGSFVNMSSNDMYLAVSRNDANPPILSDTETLLSPIVLFGPENVPLLKPCVLSIPHSADLRQGNWVIRLMCSPLPSQLDVNADSTVNTWTNISTVGCESDTTPIYIHLDPYYAYLMLDKPQRLCLVGQSYPGGKATKRLRLAAFGRPLSSNSYLPNYNIRIYVFSDTKEAFESVTSLETKMGSILLDNTHQIIFSDNIGNLFFCIEELSTGWRSQLTAKYQEIPFQDIWSGSQSETLHCAFTFDNIDPSQQTILCRITAYQSGFYCNKQTLTMKQDKTDRGSSKKDLIQHEKVLLHSETNNTYLDPMMTVFRIQIQTRKRLCMMLDNVTPRGSDWKQLCRQLSLNGYINYFMTKVSPTDAILTLWEARHRNENAIVDLINNLKAIGRVDCANLLESECSSS